MIRLINSTAAAIFGSLMSWSVYEQARPWFEAQPDNNFIVVCGAGVFVAFMVLAWFVIDRGAPRAI